MTQNLDLLKGRADSYYRMADALKFIGDTWQDQPDLQGVARYIGLSASHFQREFTHWVGISPKQYLGAITHAAAGDALRRGEDLLSTSLETGLSSPSRLHDLFIAHEALSPGEAKSGGHGVDLYIGKAPTPFGMGVYLISPRGLCGLGFIDDPINGAHRARNEQEAFADLADRYPSASIKRDDKCAEEWALKVFQSEETIPLAFYGTPFRRQVWRALLDIPAGEIETYGDVATRIGNKKASRATGSAIGANPISYLVPCHRALSSDKKLNNYHWGIDRKRAMLTYEFVACQAA